MFGGFYMYAFTMVFPNGKVKLIGFVNSTEEADELLDRICRKYGTEYIATSGAKFNVELAA